MQDYRELADKIDAQQGEGVEFGDAGSAPSDEWIRKTERALGIILPPSYVWFLKNYGGGTIQGEEHNSIYEDDFDTAGGNDLVYQYRWHLAKGLLSDEEVPLFSTELGDLFYIKSSEPTGEGEYAIYRKQGREDSIYASGFAEYLSRVIEEFCE
jgi:hypothetical protein